MKEKNKNIFDNKLFRFVVIPIALLALWLGLTCLYIITFDTSLSVLSYIHGRESFSKLTYNKLLKGDEIAGQFKAVENNLGIVSVKFQTFIRPPYLSEDTLVFRIKEKGKSSWFSVNKYRDGLMYDAEPFPFGFPKIADSKGKTYQFEIQSLNGDINNSIALSDRGQNLFSKYQVSKTLLLHNKKEFGIFIVKKFISAMLTTDVRFSSFIYLLPFLFYLLWISPFGRVVVDPLTKKISKLAAKIANDKFLKPSMPIFELTKDIVVHNLHWIIILVVLIDIFIIQLTNDTIYLIIIGLWIAVLKAYKMQSKTTFALALALLVIPPVFLFFKDGATAEKGAIWAYIFLIAGTIQALLELRSSKN
jgi:hypothetical protein